MGCVISAESKFDCAVLKQGGIYPKILLANLEDFELATVTETTGVITSIVNASGKQFFEFSCADSSNIVPNIALRAVEGGQDGFDHQIQVMAYDISQASRENIAKMRFAKVVAIVIRQDGHGELYGRNVGMRMSDFQDNPGDATTGGLISFTLKSPDNDPPEIAPSQEIFDTDKTTTIAMIDGLTTPGTP